MKSFSKTKAAILLKDFPLSQIDWLYFLSFADMPTSSQWWTSNGTVTATGCLQLLGTISWSCLISAIWKKSYRFSRDTRKRLQVHSQFYYKMNVLTTRLLDHLKWRLVWIFCVSLAMHTCKVWSNMLFSICGSIRHHLKHSVDMLMTKLEVSLIKTSLSDYFN